MTPKAKRWIALGFAFATSLLSVGACAPSGAYVEVDYAPRNFVAYPHVMYGGQMTYYVDGRWYYRHGSRWAYYSDPPARLREYRYERAPRAYPERRYGYEHDRREYDRDRREEAYRRQYQHDRRDDARRREYERARHEDARRHEHEQREHDGHADARYPRHARHDVETAPRAERVR